MYLACFLIQYMFQFIDIPAILSRDEHTVGSKSVHPCSLKLLKRYVLTLALGKVIVILRHKTLGVDLELGSAHV